MDSWQSAARGKSSAGVQALAHNSPAVPQALPKCRAWMWWVFVLTCAVLFWGGCTCPIWTNGHQVCCKPACTLAFEGLYPVGPESLVCCVQQLACSGFDGDWVPPCCKYALQGQSGYEFVLGKLSLHGLRFV